VLNFDDETWLPVPEYGGLYLVSRTGVVYSVTREAYKASRATATSDYLYVKLYRNNKMRAHSVHRLVASAFILNPCNKPMVNHIDGDKLNNNVCNLEWVTCSENHKHAFRTGLRQPSKTQLGVKCGSASKYHNVSFDSSRGKWKVAVKHNGRALVQKRFDSEEAAALFVNEVLDEHNLMDRPRNVIR